MEAKRAYQAEIKKTKSTSWKEYCNVAASTNPWSQVYKLAAGKTRTGSLHETVNVILDYIFTEDSEEDNLHHKKIRQSIEEPIHTTEDVDFTQEEIKHNRELQSQESTWIRRDHRRNLSKNVPYVSQNNNHNIQPMS